MLVQSEPDTVFPETYINGGLPGFHCLVDSVTVVGHDIMVFCVAGHIFKHYGKVKDINFLVFGTEVVQDDTFVSWLLKVA